MKWSKQTILTVSHLLEVLHWLGAATALCCALAGKQAAQILARLPLPAGGLSAYGLEMTVQFPTGGVDSTALLLFSIGATLILALMAMVFRNIRLVFRTADGKTWFSKGVTPFQQDVTRMVREIGIFYMAIPIVGLIISTLARLILGVDAIELSVRMGGFVTGVLLLFLSQVFAYGTTLQNDADGLI